MKHLKSTLIEYKDKFAAAAGKFTIGGTAMVAAGSVHAAVPVEITTAITDGQADLLTVVTALTVMAAVVYVARWILARFV